MVLCSVPPRDECQSCSQYISFKLGEHNLLLSLLTLRLTNNVKFDFAKLSYLPSDFHTNTVISDRFALDPARELRGGRNGSWV